MCCCVTNKDDITTQEAASLLLINVVISYLECDCNKTKLRYVAEEADIQTTLVKIVAPFCGCILRPMMATANCIHFIRFSAHC